MVAEIRGEGFAELVRDLDALPDKLRRKVARRAVSLAATPIARVARRVLAQHKSGAFRTQRRRKRGGGFSERKVNLQRSVRKKVRVYNQSGVAMAFVNPTEPHAGIVEFGSYKSGARKTRSGANRGVMPAIAPMRRAYYATRAQSSAILRRALREGILREWAR